MTAAYIVLGLCALVALGGVVFILITQRKLKNSMGKIAVNKGNGRKSHIYWLYRVYTKVPALNTYFKKFMSRLSMLYPADIYEVRRKATEVMTRSAGFALICMIALAFLAKTDIFYILISIFTVYIIFSNSISRSIDKMEIRLLRQFADFLTDCRSNYHTVGMVDDAIFMTLDDIPYEISLHVNKIYEVVISTNVSEEVEKYTDIAPNRFLEMFAAVCATIQEYGDKALENGESLFLKNLNYIKEEVYVEITKREKNNFLFSGLIFTCVMPIFGMKLIAMWAKSITELATFYDGPMGLVMMVLVFASTFICYELIINLRDGRAEEEKEHKFLEKMSSNVIFRRPLTNIINKNYTKALRINDNLKMIGDHISPQAYLLKRLLLATILGVASTVIILVAHIGNYISIANDFATTYEDSIVPDEAYRENMKELTKEYFKAKRHIHQFSEREIDELAEELRENEGMTEQLSGEVAREVAKRSDQYSSNYFKWWYVLIIVACIAGGYFAPIALLKYQMSIMKMSMEDEVAQYQTLALILMNVDGMTLDVILEWMERFAFCFRQSISECILNLEASEYKALKKMKDSETFPPFLRFVDNLIAIDDVGVANAFDEIITEQENYKQQRALKNEIMMAKKSNIGKDISYIPMVLTVGGYLIFPFVSYAFKMLQDMGSAMQL